MKDSSNATYERLMAYEPKSEKESKIKDLMIFLCNTGIDTCSLNEVKKLTKKDVSFDNETNRFLFHCEWDYDELWYFCYWGKNRFEWEQGDDNYTCVFTHNKDTKIKIKFVKSPMFFEPFIFLDGVEVLKKYDWNFKKLVPVIKINPNEKLLGLNVTLSDCSKYYECIYNIETELCP